VEIYDPAAARAACADFLAGRTDETQPMRVGEVEIFVVDPKREFATVLFKGVDGGGADATVPVV
jgi:hypothetical protein